MPPEAEEGERGDVELENQEIATLLRKKIVILSGPKGSGKTYLALRLLGYHRAHGGKGTYNDLGAISMVRELPVSGEFQTPVTSEIFSLSIEGRTAEALEKALANLPDGYLVVLDMVEEIPGWEEVVEKFALAQRARFVLTRSVPSALPAKAASWISRIAVEKKVSAKGRL